ncbi:hypothetical protein [Gryllotalpicola ginsengisoli]|uniref:hypothetical protein n=1 Tax=Gryllotalpicola ginsengisoli TaxID=444608 RepID=UPI0003B6FA96|nr:hypothetical protein [Gryllotalpicola ginsengisoli]
MLAALLSIEAVAVLAAVILSGLALAGNGAKSEADGVALLVCVVIGFLWVGAAAAGAWLAASWMRGLATVWQLVQLAVAAGAFEDLIGGAGLGVALLVLGLVGLGLLFTPQVTRAVGRRPEASVDDAPRR